MKREAGVFCNREESFKNSDFLLQFRVTCQRDVHNPAPQDNLPVTRSAIERRQIVDTTSHNLWSGHLCFVQTSKKNFHNETAYKQDQVERTETD